MQRKVTFLQRAGKLEAVLHQLSNELNIKFSFSHDKITPISVGDNNYANLELYAVLNSLLQTTGFTYIVVGTIIVIVEKGQETVSNDQKAIVTPDTSKGNKKSNSTLSGPNNGLSKLSKDTARRKANFLANHIYSGEANLSMLPFTERRKIRKLYSKELNRAYWHKVITWLHGNIRRKDSLKEKEKQIFPQIGNYKYYVSSGVGLVKYMPRIEANSAIARSSDIGYTGSPKVTGRLQLGGGMIFKYLMVGTGIGYTTLTVHGQSLNYVKKSNGNQGHGVGSGSSSVDSVSYSFTNQYSLFSVPLQLLLYKQRSIFFIGAGTKIQLDFIHSASNNNNFETYYDYNVKGTAYSQTVHKVAAVTSLKLEGGLLLRNGIALSALVEYNCFLTPLTYDALFTYSPNSLHFGFNCTYLLSKADLRRVKRTIGRMI